MFAILVIAVLFVLGCGYLSRLLLCDLWIKKPEKPAYKYDPEYEQYRDFAQTIKNDLEKEDINLR